MDIGWNRLESPGTDGLTRCPESGYRYMEFEPGYCAAWTWMKKRRCRRR